MKVFLWMLIGVTVLVALTCVAVYTPVVQKFAIKKASEIVARETGYRLTIEGFRLRFPLGVSLRGATVVTPAGDTLARIGSARVHAALRPLIKGRVRISDVGLESTRVAYRDTVSGIELRALIDDLSVGAVALDPAGKLVRLTRATLDGGDVTLIMGSSGDAPPPADTIPFDWTIDMRRFELRDLDFAMDMPEDSTGSTAPPAFDYRHIRVTGAWITLRDLGFRSGDISANFDGLRLAERSGLSVEEGSGDFAMDTTGISLRDFTIRTAGSHIEGSARAGSGIMDGESDATVSAQISATVSTQEIALFAPMPPQLQPVLKGKNVTMESSVNGSLDELTLEKFTAALSPDISLTAHGTLRSIAAPDRLSGNVTLDGDLANLDFVRGFVADTALGRRIAIPRGMTLHAAADFSPEIYALRELTLRADTGRLDVKGRFAPQAQTYAADVRLVDFPLGDFLPHDSLGVATLALTAQGRGYDPVALDAAADVNIDRLDYKNIDMGLIAANITAAGGNITGTIKSRNDLLAIDIALDALISRDTLPDPGAGSTLPLSYTLAARIDSTVVRLGDDMHAIDPVTLNASASTAGIEATLRSGDLAVDVSSPLPPDSLIRAAARTGSEMQRQLTERHFNPDSLQSAFPYMTLKARAGRGNFLHEMARLQGFDFRSFSADVSTEAGKPFRIDAVAVGIAAGSLEVDTLGLHASRNGEVLDFQLHLANHPTTMTDLGLISVKGSAGGRSITAGVLQQNSDGVTGFDFGIRASLENDGAVRAEMEQDPILGYERWVVGADSHGSDRVVHGESSPTDADSSENWIEYGGDGKLRADLHLTGTGISTRPVAKVSKPVLKDVDYAVVGSGAMPVAMAAAMAAARSVRHVAITSASLPGIPQGALRLTAQGLDLEGMLDLFPTAPPIGGTVWSDLTFGFHSDGAGGNIIAAKGSLGAGDFSYNSRRVADIDADVDFGSDGSGSMLLDASVKLEKRTALTAKGTYAAGEVDFALDIPSVPLSIAEGFLPAETARLTGSLDGKVHIAGAPSKPAITGDVGFAGAKAEIFMIGTTFGISPERITIADDRITFDNFGLIAPNDRTLAINGSVGIADLSAPMADLSIRTRDFQYVDSRHLGGSQIYGTASLNANITARGALDALSVRGDIDLSDDTNIVYILRGGAQKVRDEKQHIVQFVSFADSLISDDDLSVVPLRRMGVDMLLGVNIGEGLKATVSLDELNENRVELIGGGDLSLAMNSQGDTRLAGRYTLSGGTLYYKPPVIPQKIFAVEQGSYVEWAGGLMEPEFHVTATQTMDVALDYDSGEERDVRFEISVAVSGSLSGIDMVFDVAAPGDLLIQDQLLAMNDEGRMQQALTLLIYNQYTGPGVSSKGMGFDARNQLNDFISKEVNQWARNNLKGVDFSMGIDTRDDAAGGNYTDYSYSVSKSLFSDRVKISIGGKVSDQGTTTEGFADNLLEDVTLEYRLTRRDNMFLKLYRYNTRESILEGEVTETGAGFVIRKKMNRLGDIFRRSRPRRIGAGSRADSTRLNNIGRRPESTE